MTTPLLPNWTPEVVSVYPNEYITNITVNRGNLRLLENDIFLYRLMADILSQTGSWSSGASAGLSAYEILSANSGNWNSTFATVSAMSADWTLHSRFEDTTDTSPFVKEPLETGLYNHVPSWNTISGQWLDRGYNIYDKEAWSGPVVDDVSGHYFLPTCRALYKLFQTVSLSGVSQISGANEGDIAIWNSDGLLRSDGQQVNDSTALTGLSSLVPTENIVKDYADNYISSKSVVAAPTGIGQVPTYNGTNVIWQKPVPDESTWQYDQVYAGSLYTAAGGQQNVLNLQWPSAIAGITDLYDYPVAMHIVADCHVMGYKDDGASGAGNEMQSSFRRISLGFLWSGRCYTQSGGVTSWAGIGAGTHGWVSRCYPNYDAEASGFETGASLGFGASDWNWLRQTGYPTGGQPGFSASNYWKFMTEPRLWKKSASDPVEPSLGWFRFSPTTLVNYYWNIKLKVVLNRILGDPGDAAVEPYYPEGSQICDTVWF